MALNNPARNRFVQVFLCFTGSCNWTSRNARARHRGEGLRSAKGLPTLPAALGDVSPVRLPAERAGGEFFGRWVEVGSPFFSGHQVRWLILMK